MKLINYIASKFAKPNSGRFLHFARFVSFVSVMLGVMALLLSLAILNGFEKELRKSAVKFTSHITLNTFNKEPIENASQVIDLLRQKYPQIAGVSSVFEREGLVKTSVHTDGVLIKSFIPENDITNFASNIQKGKKTFSTDSSRELIIGRRLASKLGVECGEEIILYAINSTGSDMPDSRIGKFEIVGIYQTGMAQYDDVLVFMPHKTAGSFFRMPENSASKIEIILKDINIASDLSAKIMDDLGYPFWTLTFYELHSSIFAWIELQKEPIPLVLGLISIVAVLNIITTLLITVVEKTHSIGILRTLGMKQSQVIAIFVNQGLKLGVTAILSGAALALTFSYLQVNFKLIRLKGEIYFLDSLPIDISLVNYLIVMTLTFVLVLLSTIIPAYIASKLSPSNALRFK